MIFDTHAHYDDEAFNEDRDQILSSMKDGGSGLYCKCVRVRRGIWRDLGIDESVSFLCMAQWGFIPTMQEL